VSLSQQGQPNPPWVAETETLEDPSSQGNALFYSELITPHSNSSESQSRFLGGGSLADRRLIDA
jgi:hypothetical protein